MGNPRPCVVAGLSAPLKYGTSHTRMIHGGPRVQQYIDYVGKGRDDANKDHAFFDLLERDQSWALLRIDDVKH